MIQIPQNNSVDGYNIAMRDGTSITIVGLELRYKLKRTTGSQACPRVILLIDSEPINPKDYVARDILDRSSTKWVENLEELEVPDLDNNCTNLSALSFNNIVDNNRMRVLYDYQVDLNTKAIKGVVGEDIMSVDCADTKYVFFQDLDIDIE